MVAAILESPCPWPRPRAPRSWEPRWERGVAFGLLPPFVAATSVQEVVADRWQIGAVVLHGCGTLLLALAVALLLHAAQGVFRQSWAWVRHGPEVTPAGRSTIERRHTRG